MGSRVIVMWSGGKDSQACLIHSVKKYGQKNVLAVFCDTGWEHEITVSHVENVCVQMGVELITLKAERRFEELCIHKHIFQTGKIPLRYCRTNKNGSPTVEEVFDYVTRFDNLPSLFDDYADSCMSIYHGLCE